MYKFIALTSFCFFVFILWIIYLANTGSSSAFFQFVGTLPHGDKIGHASLFGFLTLLTVIGTKFKSFNCGGLKIYYAAVLIFLFTAGEEFSQAFIPSRTFDLIDLTADIFGIIVAIYLGFLVEYFLTKSTRKNNHNV